MPARTKFVVVACLLVAVLLSIPAWVGFMIKRDLRYVFQRLDESLPQTALELRSYEPGWLSSRAVVGVTLPPVDIGTRRRVRGEFDLVLDIRHGHSIRPLGLAWMSVDARLVLDAPARKRILSLFRQSHPESIRYRQGFAGDHELDIKVTPGHGHKSREDRIHFNGLQARLDWNRDVVRFEATAPGLLVRQPRYVLRARHVRWMFSAERASRTTWNAVSSGGAERYYMKGIGPMEVDISGLRFSYAVSAQPSNRIMHVHGGHGLDRISLKGSVYRNTTFDLDAYQVPGILLSAWLHALRENGTHAFGTVLQEYLEENTTLNYMIQRNPVVSIDEFRTDGPDGRIEGRLGLQWVRRREQLDLSQWLKIVNYSADLKAAPEVFESLVPAKVAGCLPYRIEGKNWDRNPVDPIAALLRKGWLDERGDRLFGQFSYRNGQLSVQYTEWPGHTAEPFRKCLNPENL